MVSVIIIQYNNSRLTKNAIESLLKFHKNNLEIILVDNNSSEPDALEFVKDFPEVKVIRNETNLGFSAANNLAAKKSSGEILLFLNNDTITTSGFINKVESEFRNDSSSGIIGPRLFNQDLSLQLSYGKLPSILRELFDKILYTAVDRKNKLVIRLIEKKYLRRTEADWVTGAALFVPKKLFFELNGFDESFFMYFEDKDLCARVRARNKKIFFFPEASLIHLRGGSFNGPDKKFLLRKYRESQIMYYRKHKSMLQQILLKIFLIISGKLK